MSDIIRRVITLMDTRLETVDFRVFRDLVSVLLPAASFDFCYHFQKRNPPKLWLRFMVRIRVKVRNKEPSCSIRNNEPSE